MTYMKKMLVALAGAAGLLGPALATAHDARLGSLHVMHPMARATLPGQQSGVVYLTVENEGSSADRLMSVSTPAASGAAIHTMSMQGTTMKMRELDSLPLAPSTKVQMTADSSYHIMLTGLKQPLKAGEQFPMTMTFEQAGKLEVSIHVAPNQAQHGAAAMPGMPAH
ncbi:MAG: copper chaperone PCu(A)C [Herminiimonas sp.]|nr:copper chaperone PCu(A)C [Herminiimonas sp.]